MSQVGLLRENAQKSRRFRRKLINLRPMLSDNTRVTLDRALYLFVHFTFNVISHDCSWYIRGQDLSEVLFISVIRVLVVARGVVDP